MSTERLMETVSEGGLRVEVWLKGDDPGQRNQYFIRSHRVNDAGELAENPRDFTMDEIGLLPTLHDRAYQAIRMLVSANYKSRVS